ncbi:MAG: RluA family pseudouridine synthase [Pirellulaceae bacterium]|jgi:RluA family pseudouridine synthase|nr:RluA family pseudouridine synthase [Pirellulaceae bacterium]
MGDDSPPIEILYEDGPCLVVNKPGGLLTQAPPHIDSLESRIKQFLKHHDDKRGNVYLGVPHRLDRPVSGAMVFAKHVRAARRLAEQFEGRLVEKTYWAVVEDDETIEQSAQWRDYLRKIPNEARAEVVPTNHPEARIALLNYVVGGRVGGQCWMEITLETGRMHQIRIQAGSRGLPILGDELYGSQRLFGPTTDDRRSRWIALHARTLSFRHPMTKESVTIEAPLPTWWGDLPFDW